MNRHGSHLPQDFKSCVSANSTTPAVFSKKATPGFEPGIKVLQTSALPLGYAAIIGAEDGIRTRDPHLGKVVFYH
ncbi:uncharacterized protein BTUAT1_08410 [Bacillus altitudinis]|nr:uncharacterized protein BTUAT1_08410 [Bacillus pumilus]